MKISTKRIRAELANKKMTYTALAEKCQMSKQNLSTVLKRGTCSSVTAGKIAEALGINAVEFVETD